MQSPRVHDYFPRTRCIDKTVQLLDRRQLFPNPVRSELPVAQGQFWGEPMKHPLVCVYRYLSFHALDGNQPISGWHQARDIGIAPMLSGYIRLSAALADTRFAAQCHRPPWPSTAAQASFA